MSTRPLKPADGSAFKHAGRMPTASEINELVAKAELPHPDDDKFLSLIATKVSRITAGRNPEHYDSWYDIAGYATLGADRFAPPEGAKRAGQ